MIKIKIRVAAFFALFEIKLLDFPFEKLIIRYVNLPLIFLRYESLDYLRLFSSSVAGTKP